MVSLEVSPLLAHETAKTSPPQRNSLRGGRPNLFIKIPAQGRFAGHRGGDLCGCAGQRDTPIFARAIPGGRGVFARHRTAYCRRLNPQVGSVASMFISRWDAAVAGKVPETLSNRLGIAVAGRIYKAYLDQLSNRAASARTITAPDRNGAVGQHGHEGSQSLRHSLHQSPGFPFTVNTMPSNVKSLADHGELASTMAPDVAIANSIGRVREGRHPCGRPGRPTTGRGRKIVCEILERIAGRDRIQGRRAQEDGLEINQRLEHIRMTYGRRPARHHQGCKPYSQEGDRSGARAAAGLRR